MRLSVILVFLQLWWKVEVSLSHDACSELPFVPKAFVSDATQKAEYEKGDVIDFTCETGYISNSTIKYVCIAGGWLEVLRERCYLKPCERPDDLPNGYHEIILGDELVVGTVIQYFCNEGYQMVGKDDNRTCLLDGWSKRAPICEHAPKCKRPPPLLDGDTKNSVLFKYDHNDRVEYMCQNFYFMEGDPYLTCINGQWTGRMRCLKPCTVNRDDMNSHKIMFTYTYREKLYSTHNDEMEFRCISGYRHDEVQAMRQRCIDGEINLPTCR